MNRKKIVDYETVRDELKKFRYTVYIVYPNNTFEFAFKFDGFSKELKKYIEETYKKKNKPGMFFVAFKFSFHTGTKIFQGGPLAVKLRTFIFNDNGDLVSGLSAPEGSVMHRFQYMVWFQRKFIETNGWDDKYFERMISYLLAGKARLRPLVANLYNVDFF